MAKVEAHVLSINWDDSTEFGEAALEVQYPSGDRQYLLIQILRVGPRIIMGTEIPDIHDLNTTRDIELENAWKVLRLAREYPGGEV